MFICRHYLEALCHLLNNVKMPFYAVRNGRVPGVYNTWDDCKRQVDKFFKARYKKFSTSKEAWDFVNGSDTSFTPGSSAPRPVVNNNIKNNNNNSATSSQAASVSTKMSPEIRLKLAEKEIEYLKEKLKLKESEKKLLETKAEIQHLKEQAKQEPVQGKSPVTRHILHSQKPYLPAQKLSQPAKKLSRSAQSGVSSANWRQNKTTQLISSAVTKNVRTSTQQQGGDGGSAVVYTDGACINNGQGDPRAGIGVYWGPDHPLNVSERLPGRQTNNRAEIQAVVRAVHQAKSLGFKDLTVKTDSMFLINSMTKWLPGWQSNGWRLASGGPVKNREDFENLISAMNGIKVNWVHVAGHRGIEGNEQADRLAVQGACKS